MIEKKIRKFYNSVHLADDTDSRIHRAQVYDFAVKFALGLIAAVASAKGIMALVDAVGALRDGDACADGE